MAENEDEREARRMEKLSEEGRVELGTKTGAPSPEPHGRGLEGVREEAREKVAKDHKA